MVTALHAPIQKKFLSPSVQNSQTSQLLGLFDSSEEQRELLLLLLS
jgi:hypothetical protein